MAVSLSEARKKWRGVDGESGLVSHWRRGELRESGEGGVHIAWLRMVMSLALVQYSYSILYPWHLTFVYTERRTEPPASSLKPTGKVKQRWDNPGLGYITSLLVQLR